VGRRLPKNRKRLVIDACVARAAGETDHPVSSSCRKFLDTVLTICHRLVMTDAIRDEWDRHQSRYARMWRAAMTARRKVDRLDADPADNTAERINAIPMSGRKRKAVLKDRHLVEAALRTDGIIASLDDEALGILREILPPWRAIRRVVWVNPGRPEERCCDWLAAGAKPDKQRMIGHRASD